AGAGVFYRAKRLDLPDNRTPYANPLHPPPRALIAGVPAAPPAQRRRGRRERLADDIPSALHPPSGCRFHTRCPHAMPICREQEPRITEPAPGHMVTCHRVG